VIDGADIDPGPFGDGVGVEALNAAFHDYLGRGLEDARERRD
jgi:hypothetical protein